MIASATVHLDCRGLACPLPVIESARALRRGGPGTVVEVLADDPAAEGDFRAFCLANGHELVAFLHVDRHYQANIRRVR